MPKCPESSFQKEEQYGRRPVRNTRNDYQQFVIESRVSRHFWSRTARRFTAVCLLLTNIQPLLPKLWILILPASWKKKFCNLTLLKSLIRNIAAVSMPRAELIKCVCFDLPCDKEKKKKWDVVRENVGTPQWWWTCISKSLNCGKQAKPSHPHPSWIEVEISQCGSSRVFAESKNCWTFDWSWLVYEQGENKSGHASLISQSTFIRMDLYGASVTIHPFSIADYPALRVPGVLDPIPAVLVSSWGSSCRQ